MDILIMVNWGKGEGGKKSEGGEMDREREREERKREGKR